MFQLREVQRLLEVAAKYEWQAYIEHFLFWCKIKNLTQSTVRGYAERLMYLISYLKIELQSVTRQHLDRYIHHLVMDDSISDVTVNGRIIVYRIFFRYLFDEGLIESDISSYLKKIRAEKKIKDIISPKDLMKVLSICDKRTFYGYRNYLILLTFYDSMIRRNELIRLRMSDIDLKNGIMKVYGKGRKERFVPIGIKTRHAISFYLTKYRKQIPGEYLFCTGKGNMIDGDNCRQIVMRIGKQIDIALTPHLIRHSAATQYLRLGGSPVILQKILGHTSPVVTAIYTHMDTSDMVKSYETISPSSSLVI